MGPIRHSSGLEVARCRNFAKVLHVFSWGVQKTCQNKYEFTCCILNIIFYTRYWQHVAENFSLRWVALVQFFRISIDSGISGRDLANGSFLDIKNRRMNQTSKRVET